MFDLFVTVLVLVVAFVLGVIAVAVFLYAIEQMQNGGRDD
jgi:nitrogen fixation-related uncharacterized protein